MYKLRIRLDSDGDFHYTSDIINFDKPEINIYYDNRNVAINKLRTFYSMMTKTIGTSKEHVWDKIDTIKKFKDYLDLIIDKFDTFYIHFELGNIDLTMELCKINSEAISDGGIIFNEEDVTLVLYPTMNFINEYNWDVVKECPSVIEEDVNNEIIQS